MFPIRVYRAQPPGKGRFPRFHCTWQSLRHLMRSRAPHILQQSLHIARRRAVVEHAAAQCEPAPNSRIRQITAAIALQSDQSLLVVSIQIAVKTEGLMAEAEDG